MLVKIKNVVGTSNDTCNCKTWLEHWKNYGGRTIPTFCPVDKCLNKDVIGAHVRKVGESTIYIFPLCKEHNNSNEEMSVSDSWNFVPADNKTTCGKG